ncbi:MAG: DUF1571 domain-containing protein [Planctomycetaceae bacterium]
MYTSFDPAPAGENGTSLTTTSLSSSGVDFEVPLPVDIVDMPLPGDTDAATVAADDSSTAAAPAVRGSYLNDQETIRFSLLLLQDGARMLESVERYTAAFHKQERINGDMTEAQSIDLKIQHSPHFAVYMKWRNFDKGRQVLYSDEYEDGNMVVKLGGLKGRFIPAVKLNPLSGQAMAESRHPITQAGILGMLKEMIVHRQNDLKHGHGMKCTRLPNQEFDERDCYCFLYEYDSPEFSELYRKSVVLIDTRRNIPMLVRNYTWAVESEGLSTEELDKLTLIENYSFTEVDFDRELVATDFSRENPKYRM